MTLVDSVDSVLMLYSYAGLIENPSRWKIFEPKQSQIEVPQTEKDHAEEKEVNLAEKTDLEENVGQPTTTAIQEQMESKTTTKMNVMSGLSIILTLMSIIVAFAYVPQSSFLFYFFGLMYLSRISLITIMGLIQEHCSQCTAAANAEDGGGIAGAWWRGWANVCLYEVSFIHFHLMSIVRITRRESTPVTLALVSWAQLCQSLQYGILPGGWSGGISQIHRIQQHRRYRS
jgi:high-affinity nickel-transport protein